MSEEQQIDLLLAEPAKDNPTLLQLNELRMGYVVGLTEEGKFIFEIVGKNQELIDLLGLHKFAEVKVTDVLNISQNRGDKLTHDIGRAVTSLAQEVAKLVSMLKKPDNSLKKI